MDVHDVVGPDGWAGRAQLLQRTSPRTLSAWVTSGWLVRLAPAVLATPAAGPVHVTAGDSCSGRGSPGTVRHRNPAAVADRRRVDGLPVTSVERAVVDSWGSAGPPSRDEVRAAAITAVRRRLCRPADLAHELDASTRLPGRADLADLVRLLADGCRSELEIWGCLRVLRAPGMPAFTQQRRVTVGRETFFLDAAYDDAVLAVEMDGAAWHGSGGDDVR